MVNTRGEKMLARKLLRVFLDQEILTLFLLTNLLASCQTVYTNECLWYTPPKDEQLLEIAYEHQELFKIEAQNKLKYEEICK